MKRLYDFLATPEIFIITVRHNAQTKNGALTEFYAPYKIKTKYQILSFDFELKLSSTHNS
jgi:hypothetical protein